MASHGTLGRAVSLLLTLAARRKRSRIAHHLSSHPTRPPPAQLSPTLAVDDCRQRQLLLGSSTSDTHPLADMDKFEGVAWSRDYDHGMRDGGSSPIDSYHDHDVFGREEGHDIKYKTLSWQIVAILMIAEIVSNGMLSLPSSLATVGMVPGLILIIFLGVFAAWTSLLLVRFKLRHPEVHNMGDAGKIMFGFIGREVFAFGTLCFAICLAGGQMLSGQIALTALSDHGLCNISFTGIFCAATFICALPRTFDNLGWISVGSVMSILIAGVVGMVGAGIHPVEPRVVVAARSSDFYTAFFSITNPVFAYCGHFM